MDKVDYYKELFSSNDISFSVNAFIGEYDGKHYPHAYSDDEKRMLGLDRPSRYWLHRIEPQLNRIEIFAVFPAWRASGACISRKRASFTDAGRSQTAA